MVKNPKIFINNIQLNVLVPILKLFKQFRKDLINKIII